MRWLVRKGDVSKVITLSSKYGINKHLVHTLVARGIENLENYFINGKKDLPSPFELRGIEEAVDIFLNTKRKILVWGDYDTDGVTSVALLIRFINKYLCTDCVEWKIPNRFEDGYGINFDRIKTESPDADLIVFVDCGSSEKEVIQKLLKMGKKVVVLDHHKTDWIPDNNERFAMVNPSIDWPINLPAVGVVYKLITAIMEKMGRNWRNSYVWEDLVAVGIVSDVMPVLYDNKVLLEEGMKVLNSSPIVGLKVLMEILGMNVATPKSLGFILIPRLNAPGRVGGAECVVELLLTDDEKKAWEYAALIDKLNRDRQRIEQRVNSEVRKMLKNFYNREENANRPIVLCSDSWHVGVIGIVASKLKEEYGVPVILITRHDDKYIGSARAPDGVNLHSLLSNFEEYFEEWGGHKLAVGFTLKRNKVEEFLKALREYKLEVKCEGVEFKENFVMEPVVYVDKVSQISDFRDEIMSCFDRMKPFGASNAEPIFLLRGVRIFAAGDTIRLEKKNAILYVDDICISEDVLVDKIGKQVDALIKVEFGVKNRKITLIDISDPNEKFDVDWDKYLEPRVLVEIDEKQIKGILGKIMEYGDYTFAKELWNKWKKMRKKKVMGVSKMS